MRAKGLLDPMDPAERADGTAAGRRGGDGLLLARGAVSVGVRGLGCFGCLRCLLLVLNVFVLMHVACR